jgi:hypothetical protein
MDLHDIVNQDCHRCYVYFKINLFKLEGKEDQHHCRFSELYVEIMRTSAEVQVR